MEITCMDCGTVFVRTQPKGRPSTRCPDCQTVAAKERAREYQRELKQLMRAARPALFCIDCGAEVVRSGGPTSKRCQPCRDVKDRERRNAWRRKKNAERPLDPGARSAYHLKKTYGLTPEDVDRMLLEQGGCGICHAQESESVKGWHVDHDHGTGRVRAILCHHCNTGIGMLREDPDMLEAAAQYLRRHQAVSL